MVEVNLDAVAVAAYGLLEIRERGGESSAPLEGDIMLSDIDDVPVVDAESVAEEGQGGDRHQVHAGLVYAEDDRVCRVARYAWLP